MTIQYMTVEQVAEYLQLNTQTVSRMAQRGDLPAAKVGRHWRFRKDLLDAELEKQLLKEVALAGALT